ncbi:MAG: hypothetical protein WAW88_05615 [Nocardioides sp.]
MSEGYSAPRPVDPFELPEWMGTDEVVWQHDGPVGTSHHVRGKLTSPRHTQELACDLLAVDEAYPAPVADDSTRLLTHQVWRHGQVNLVEVDGRLTLLSPGTVFTPAGVLDCLDRLARAVGARPAQYAALLRVGAK